MANSATAETSVLRDAPVGALREWREGWLVILAAFFGCMLMGIGLMSMGAFMAPIQAAFGWNRSEFSLGFSLCSGPGLLLPPLVGMLIDRLGPRVMAVIGSVAVAAAFTLFASLTGSIGNWLALWVIFGIASQLIVQTLWYAAVVSTFSTSRGLALAIAMAGTACAGVIAPLMANWLIEAYGFRIAFVAMGVSWGGVVAATSLVGMPRRVGQPRSGVAQAADAPAAPLTGLTVKEALRTSAFFKLMLINFISFLVLIGVMIHLIPLLADAGVARSVAVLAASSFGFAIIVGQVTAGLAVDRVPARFIAALFNFTLCVSLLMLAAPKPSVAWATAAALLAGLSCGGVAPTYPYLASHCFGMRSFGQLYGYIACASAVGAALGPLIAGYVHDVSHAYTLFLLGCLPGVALVIAASLSLKAYPDFDEPARHSRAGTVG